MPTSLLPLLTPLTQLGVPKQIVEFIDNVLKPIVDASTSNQSRSVAADPDGTAVSPPQPAKVRRTPSAPESFTPAADASALRQSQTIATEADDTTATPATVVKGKDRHGSPDTTATAEVSTTTADVSTSYGKRNPATESEDTTTTPAAAAKGKESHTLSRQALRTPSQIISATALSQGECFATSMHFRGHW